MLVGCSQPDDGYFPLGSDLKWEYRFIKQFGQDVDIGLFIPAELLGSNVNGGKSVIVQQPGIDVEGVSYFPFRYANGEIVYYSINEAGIQRSSKPGENAKIVFKLPFQLDTQWRSDTSIELLNSRHESFSGGESFITQDEKIILNNKIVSFDETVAVPAGKFANTMRIDSVASVKVTERTQGIHKINIEQTEWYAKGVGLIKRIRKEVSVPEKYNAIQATELIRFEAY